MRTREWLFESIDHFRPISGGTVKYSTNACGAVASIAKLVREFIDRRPVIPAGLGLRIVNHSALARMIGKELGIRKGGAVLAACRRDPTSRLPGYREEAGKRGLGRGRGGSRGN